VTCSRTGSPAAETLPSTSIRTVPSAGTPMMTFAPSAEMEGASARAGPGAGPGAAAAPWGAGSNPHSAVMMATVITRAAVGMDACIMVPVASAIDRGLWLGSVAETTVRCVAGQFSLEVGPRESSRSRQDGH